MSVRGDLIISLWKNPARLHRTRWFFDLADEALSKSPHGLLVLQLILPTASPPDAPTRAENAARLRKIGSFLRRAVTVPLGDAIFLNVVRTVMRAMFLVQGQSHVQLVESSIPAGIDRIIEAGGESTPGRPQIERDIQALYKALEVPLPVDLNPSSTRRRSSPT